MKHVFTGPGLIGGNYGKSTVLSSAQRNKPSRRSAARTFLIYDASESASAKISSTPGAINNLVAKIGATLIDATIPPKLTVITGAIYLHAVVSGTTITALTIENAASVPASTATDGYKLLATVVVTDNAITSLTPLGWNFTEMQKCGTATYHWGGFGT